MPVYILTLRINGEAQAFFDTQRTAYFPKERNFLNAHLTLFHHLEQYDNVAALIEGLKFEPFNLEISSMLFLGRGVAYKIESEQLLVLRSQIASQFWSGLTPQDRQKFQPHITIQNKVDSTTAKALFDELKQNFSPFRCTAIGLDIWEYLNGPWKHKRYFPFD